MRFQINFFSHQDTLISSWSRLGDLVSQVPLGVLNVSANHLPLPLPALRTADFSHLTHLIIGELGYTWAQVEAVAGHLPRLTVLQAFSNKIVEVSVSQGTFLQLEELDLDGNPLAGWRQSVSPLNRIAKLRSLRLNGTGLTDVQLDDGSFPYLRSIQILDNGFCDWASVGELNKLSVTDLRLRNCPLFAQTGDSENCRSITIALIASLDVLNSSGITKAERRWAEIDYLKKHGGEYLRVKALADPAAMAEFSAAHGRYEEIVARHGEPQEGEDRVQVTTLSALLVAVTVRCPEQPGAADTVKKLPTSMTVAKLKALLHRLFK
jgi:Leucine-rich repeat (LRR) protein